MEKIIMINGKETRIKVSAATNILYKRVFKEDILLQLSAYSKNLMELKEIQAKMNRIQADTTKTKEEIASEMTDLVSSDVFDEINSFSSDVLPKLAYIMYLEANETEITIFRKLNEECYLIWLLGIDQNELLNITKEVMELWQTGAVNTSKQKN